MDKLAQYFSQPSTYKGIAMIASVFGIGIPVTVQQAICQAVVGLIGAWAVVRDEYKGKLSQLDHNNKKKS